MFSVLSVALWLVLSGQVIDIPLITAKDYYRQGMDLMRKRSYDSALKYFKIAVDKQPDYPEAYYGRGLAYSSLRLYPKASADFSKSIELKADYAEAYVGRGRACININKGPDPKCLPDLDQALKLNPKLIDGYILRGLFYAQKGEFPRAKADLDQAVKLHPRNGEALFARAGVLVRMGNKPAAVEDLKRVAEFGSPAMANAARRTLQQMGR